MGSERHNQRTHPLFSVARTPTMSATNTNRQGSDPYFSEEYALTLSLRFVRNTPKRRVVRIGGFLWH